MTEEKDLRFKCEKCGSNKLGYKKYSKCITPVSLQKNSNFEYGESEFDEDNYLISQNGFICMDCKSEVEHCGIRMATEKQLLDYLSMDPDVRNKEQAEYEDGMFPADLDDLLIIEPPKE